MDVTYWIIFLLFIPIVLYINPLFLFLIGALPSFILGNTPLKGKPAGLIGSFIGAIIYWYFCINFVWQYFTERNTPLALMCLSILLIFLASRGTPLVAANEGNKVMSYAEIFAVFILIVIGIYSGESFL